MNEGIPTIEYCIYARKSTEPDDKQILSNPSQIAELQSLAKDRNVVKTLEESQSAKIPGRPVFNLMLKDIENGKCRGIIVWHPDRLSRNAVDTGKLIYLLDIGKLLEIVTPGQTFKNTPNDKFMLNLFCSTAKLENDNKGVNVKRGLKTKADMGWLPSGAKPGYTNDPYAEKGNKRIKEDIERFPIIKKAWEFLLTGNHTPPKILDIINNQLGYRTPKKKRIGGNPMSRSQIYTIFHDPFYYGMFEFPVGSGNWHQGRHKTMITQEEFEKAQEILAKNGGGQPRPQIYDFAFTGMIRCGECGAMITAERKTKRQKNGNVHYYVYYHCTKRKNPNCSQGVIEEKELAAQIIVALNGLEIPQDLHEFGLRRMREENEKQAGTTQNLLAKLQKEYKECVATLDGIIDMRARKEIGEDDYKRRIGDAQKEKKRLEELLKDAGGQIDSWVKTADEAFEFVEHAQMKFKNGTWEKKREILLTLGSNLILKDKKLDINMEKTLIPMKTVSHESKKILETVRTAKKPLNKKEIERLYARCPSMLRGWDSNPRPKD